MNIGDIKSSSSDDKEEGAEYKVKWISNSEWYGSVYLFGQSTSREFPSQINISASQIIFFASQMTFPASQMFFSVIILFPELKLSIILFS